MIPAGEIGLGTHQSLKDKGSIVRHAMKEGCKFIDTAPNYGGGANQAIIGNVLASSRYATEIENIILSTKVGFIPSNTKSAELLSAGVRIEDVVGNHCISPAYIRYQTRKNREDLRGRRIDYLFLHNPELQLRNTTRTSVLTRILLAIETCERLCEEGHIAKYGIATWKGFFDVITLADLEAGIGGTVGQHNRFAALQLPVSLVRIEEVAAAWLSHKGLLFDARERGLMIFGSSPLHNGEVLKLISPSLIRYFNGDLTAAQFALNFARSTGLLDVVLVGTNSAHHLKEAMQVRNIAPFDKQEMTKAIDMLV